MSGRSRNFRKAEQRARDAHVGMRSAALGSTRRQPSKALLRAEGKRAYEEWLRRQAACQEPMS
jgi:hypothetical protein